MRYIQGLSCAFTFKIGEYRFNSGNNAYNAISIWKIDEYADEDKIMQENTRIMTILQANAPCYHTRAMRKNYLRPVICSSQRSNHQHSEQYTEC